MTKSSPSVLFERYTDLYCDQTWEEFFSDLFGSDSKAQLSYSITELYNLMYTQCIQLDALDSSFYNLKDEERN